MGSDNFPMGPCRMLLEGLVFRNNRSFSVGEIADCVSVEEQIPVRYTFIPGISQNGGISPTL